MRRFSLQGRLLAVLALTLLVGVLLGALGQRVIGLLSGTLVLVMAPTLPLVVWLGSRLIEPVTRLLRALTGMVDSYRDGDFSISLAVDRDDELGDLVHAHNALATTLREQRQGLIQRELLLETVMQNTPVAVLLVDAGGHVVYANIAARQLFNEGRLLNGQRFERLLEDCPEPLRRAVQRGEDALFGVEIDGLEEMFHASQRGFRLHGQPHRLHLFRRMTRELSRQEVATWKKVIRVISHELNNSLAPISSLAHSGRELARRGDLERLPGVFDSIGERARHLHGFLGGYASFAKLPVPRLAAVDWADLVAALATQAEFALAGPLPAQPGWFDRAQVEQVLINLLRNAREAGGEPGAIELAVQRLGAEWRIEVRDRGPGMSEQVLANALLPFYSTKRSGTGLGLALAREIVEAHGGRIMLANREGGGLSVSLTLPVPSPAAADAAADAASKAGADPA